MCKPYDNTLMNNTGDLTNSRKFRKDQDILIYSGLGTIAYGGWAIIKTILLIVMRYEKTMQSYGIDPADTATVYIVSGVVFFLLIYALCFRIYIGRSAIREGKNKKQGAAYIPAAFLLILIGILSVFMDFFSYEEYFDDFMDGFSTILLDVTSLVTLIQLVISAIRVRKVRKSAALQKAEGAGR